MAPVSEYRNQFYDIIWKQTGLDPTKENFTVIDFGCGTGLMTEKIIANYPNVKVNCIDAAATMVLQVHQKIQSREWTNVEAYQAILGRFDIVAPDTKEKLSALFGKADLIIASSVMNFIPKPDLAKTMEVISKFLKPNEGVFIHSDWPFSDDEPDGFTTEKCKKMLEAGNLQHVQDSIETIHLGGEEAKIFVGIGKAKS